jgi:dihydroxy-acid dehydratase
LVGLAGCDKSLPGMMMVMCRLNVPSIFIYGARSSPVPSRASRSPCKMCSRPSASIRSARCRTATVETLRAACLSVPPVPAGRNSPPTPWRPRVRGDRLALPYSAGAPRPYEIRDAFCMTGGGDDPRSIKSGIRPRGHRHQEGA